MSPLQGAEHLLVGLSRAEKAQLLQWIVQDLGDAFPGIESRPGVCGGEPRVVRTRITVWTLVRARELGLTDAEIPTSYPSLRAEDLASAWAFARSHADELAEQIRASEAA